MGNGIGIDFISISDEDLIDPLGMYTLSQGINVMTTEVTQAMFKELLGYDAHAHGATNSIGSNRSTHYVNWHMAADCANVLTEKFNVSNNTSLAFCYSCQDSMTESVTCSNDGNPYICDGFRLPTEAVLIKIIIRVTYL